MAKKRTWTREKIAALTPEEYQRHRDEILEAVADGRIERGDGGVLGASVRSIRGA